MPIWQWLWAAAQERRYRTVVYREEGTKVPSLITGGVASMNMNKRGSREKEFTNGASLAAVQHLLRTIIKPLLYDYGLWMDNHETMQSFQALPHPWTVDRGLRGHRKGPKPAISLVYLNRMYSVLVIMPALYHPALSFLLSFFPSFLLSFFPSFLLCFFASLLLCFFASLLLCFLSFFSLCPLLLCVILPSFYSSFLVQTSGLPGFWLY